MSLRAHVQNIKQQDPAMKSVAEIVLYPSFWAVGFHRVAHWLFNRKLRWLARFISQLSRWYTGIEIHPGAVIGSCLFIDHGMGVVIGETCIIGDYVTIFQGVTLGGTGKQTGKRHPTIGNHVIIGSGAKVLGPFTVGDNSRVGAGSVVLQEVPPDSTVVGIPGRVVIHGGHKTTENTDKNDKLDKLDQSRMPDPVSKELCRLRNRVDKLEEKLAALTAAIIEEE